MVIPPLASTVSQFDPASCGIVEANPDRDDAVPVRRPQSAERTRIMPRGSLLPTNVEEAILEFEPTGLYDLRHNCYRLRVAIRC